MNNPANPMAMHPPPPNARLIIDGAALVANWRALDAATAAETGAAIKADGYGLGARTVMDLLVTAGCRRFWVAHWAEVAALLPLPAGVQISVLHGIMPGEMPAALALPAAPVLGTPAQVAAWRETGRPCELMVDTGMNRLGLAPADVPALAAGLDVQLVHSHLACAELPDHPLNQAQRAAFAAVAAQLPGVPAALANSGGIALGPQFHFDVTRPGIALFGGGLLPGGGHAYSVARLQARVMQLRHVPAGASVGYGATFVAARDTRLATVALGYADGFPRAYAGLGHALVGGVACPMAGRLSMDMMVFDVTDAPPLAEGDWIDVPLDLPALSAGTGRSEYEILTGLGRRFERVVA